MVGDAVGGFRDAGGGGRRVCSRLFGSWREGGAFGGADGGGGSWKRGRLGWEPGGSGWRGMQVIGWLAVMGVRWEERRKWGLGVCQRRRGGLSKIKPICKN